MGTTFAEYAASADAREQIAANVEKWTKMLCEALRMNYIKYTIRCIHRNHEMFGNGEPLSTYHAERLVKLNNDECDMEFVFESGRKYHKIWQVDAGGSRSCHAFIDKKTGEVYKPASYKAPAKGVRYNLLIIKEREYLLNPANCDWAGGYLYRNSSYFCS